MNLIVMGPVGSGKSTQAELLAQHLGLSLFNAGDLLYFKSREDTPIGRKVRQIMETGGLVDDELVLKLIEEHLEGKEHGSGIVIDGFPRSLWQAQNFGFPIDGVIYLVVGDGVNKERLLKRGRKDDTSEIIDKRLSLYHKETEPILDFYRKKGILIEVDGERPIETIQEDIVAKVKERLNE